MKRKTFVKASLSLAAAAAVPIMHTSVPRALAREELATTTLTWWNWGDPPVNVNAAATSAVSHNSPNDAVKVYYQQSHPGVVIDSTSYPYPDYVTALKTSFAGGNEPDTVEMEPGPLINEYQPFLVPLDSMAAKRWGSDWRSQFFPLAITQTLAADPQRKAMYGLPVGLECGTALYYNTQIFAKYGLKPAKSYADLKNIADILNSHNIIPLAWGAKDGWPNFDWYRMIVEQTAPGLWDQALAGKVPFTSPGLVRPLEILLQMQKDRIFPRDVWGTTAYPEAVTLFQSGKAAMYASGSWDLLGFARPPALIHDRLGMFPLPPLAAGLKPGRLWGTTNMMTAVTKQAKDVAAAFDFIAWQADQGQKSTWVDKVGFLPSRKGMKTAPMPTAQAAQIEQYFLKELSGAVIRYGPPLTAALQRALEDAIANVSTLGMAPDRAMAAVEAAYKQGAKS